MKTQLSFAARGFLSGAFLSLIVLVTACASSPVGSARFPKDWSYTNGYAPDQPMPVASLWNRPEFVDGHDLTEKAITALRRSLDGVKESASPQGARTVGLRVENPQLGQETDTDSWAYRLSGAPQQRVWAAIELVAELGDGTTVRASGRGTSAFGGWTTIFMKRPAFERAIAAAASRLAADPAFQAYLNR